MCIGHSIEIRLMEHYFRSNEICERAMCVCVCTFEPYSIRPPVNAGMLSERCTNRTVFLFRRFCFCFGFAFVLVFVSFHFFSNHHSMLSCSAVSTHIRVHTSFTLCLIAMKTKKMIIKSTQRRYTRVLFCPKKFFIALNAEYAVRWPSQYKYTLLRYGLKLF